MDGAPSGRRRSIARRRNAIFIGNPEEAKAFRASVLIAAAELRSRGLLERERKQKIDDEGKRVQGREEKSRIERKRCDGKHSGPVADAPCETELKYEGKQ